LEEDIMRASRVAWVALVVVSLIGHASRVRAQDAAGAQALRSEIDQLKRDFEARLAALEARLAALGGQPAPTAIAPGQPGGQPASQPTAQVPAGAEGVGGPTGALPVYGNVSAASKIFNPDAAVIGNFLGAGGSNRGRSTSALEMRESEVSLQAIVDPYARADFFLAFGEEGVDLEEGFITFPTLPGGLLVKVGKQRAAFGKVNTFHTHVMPWADRPLVTENLVNGEEGLADAGVSVARLIPNRWLFLEATGQVFRGDSGELFRSSQRSDLSYVAHLRGYHDLSESLNLDLGTSFAHGHNAAGIVDGQDIGRFTTQLFGIDATLRWRPLQRGLYHSFVGRSEVVWRRQQAFAGRSVASGFYLSGDYQLNRRWYAGARVDRSARAESDSLRDTGQSLTLTYWPSEFSQVRGQLRRTRYAEGITANEALFQLQFSIGAHGAHPF
jgi:hypothetical protein